MAIEELDPSGAGDEFLPSSAQVEAYVRHMVSGFEEERRQRIMSGIAQTTIEPRKFVEIAIDSGYSAGVEDTFLEMYPGYQEAYKAMIQAIGNMDEVLKGLQPGADFDKLTEARNGLSELVHKHVAAESREQKIERVKQYYDLPYGDTLYQESKDLDALTQEEVSIIGTDILSKGPTLFVAYYHFKDRSLECKCPSCLIDAWDALPSEDTLKYSLKLAAESKPDQGYAMLHEFVKWFVTRARDMLKKATEEKETELPPRVSERESEVVVNDFLHRMGVGVKGGK